MIRRLAVEVANEIRMLRSHHSGSFLVVEGFTDRKFMEAFTCDASFKVVEADGKANVQHVIRILDEDNFEGALGLIDADFDRVTAPHTVLSNIVMYDWHDLETMLFSSSAFDRVLLEFGSADKISQFSSDVREEIVCRSVAIGYFRLYSTKENLGLRFKGLDFSRWIDRASFRWSVSKLVATVKNRSQRHELNSQALEEKVCGLMKSGYDSYEICRGWDLLEVLAIGLRGVLGSCSSSEVSVIVLGRALRLACSEQEFANFGVVKRIRTWEAKSVEFRILRESI